MSVIQIRSHVALLHRAIATLESEKAPILGAETDLIIGLFGEVPKKMHWPHFRPLDRMDSAMVLMQRAFHHVRLEMRVEPKTVVARLFSEDDPGYTTILADGYSTFPHLTCAVGIALARLAIKQPVRTVGDPDG